MQVIGRFFMYMEMDIYGIGIGNGNGYGYGYGYGIGYGIGNGYGYGYGTPFKEIHKESFPLFCSLSQALIDLKNSDRNALPFGICRIPLLRRNSADYGASEKESVF